MSKNQSEETKAEASEEPKPEKIVRSMATIDDLMEAKPIVMEVPAPELGKGRFLRVLLPSPDQAEELEAEDNSGPKGRRKKGYLGRWARAGVVNERNEKTITAEQAAKMQKMPGINHLLERIFLCMVRGPRVTEDAVEAEVKNS